MMKLSLKRKLYSFIFSIIVAIGIVFPLWLCQARGLPSYEKDFTSSLKWWVYNYSVDKNKSLRENIIYLFYPRGWGNTSALYEIIRDITLWVMIIFIVWAWASLLLNKKPEESKKHLLSIWYILLWWVFIYWANRLFWDVFKFTWWDDFTTWESWLEWFTDSLITKVFFFVLSAIKAFAFFLAIIMAAVTWFKVMSAWEWEKWKKLMKWLINVVVALLIIKWIDFIYYVAEDSQNFVTKVSDFIIKVAKLFGWIYWVVVVIMVIVAGYLYITDGWSWSNFKKATNVIVNILLSWLVLFSFLLITYQIFAEFQKWGDAVTDTTQPVWQNPSPENPVSYVSVDYNYV